MSDLPQILLIHGAALGAWIWRDVFAPLADLGLNARAIDLPGREGAASLDDQARAIVQALRGPTILLGHSAAGYAITAAAETGDPRIKGLIYLCAYVPKAGKSLQQMRMAGPAQPLAGGFVVDRSAGTFRFDHAVARRALFSDCPEPDLAVAELCPQALAPMETALASVARAEALPRGAIICRHDQAIPPDYQREMAMGIAETCDLPTGHAPFLSAPSMLSKAIFDLAATMR